MTYDPLNREATKSPTGEAEVTYSYDLAGRLLSASTPAVSGDPSTGTFALSYDTAGRLIEETTPDSLSVQYGLDANGNMTKLTWPDSYYVNYQYDQLNRPTGISLNGATAPAVKFAYDALSRRIQLSNANGTFTNYRYNLDDTLSSLNLSFPFANSTALKFNYNQVGQKTAQGVNGNLPVVGIPPLSGVAGYTTNSVNEYTAVGSSTPTYDGNGNLTGFGSQTFSYDTENHLLSATKSGTTTTYEYDPFERQTLKSASSTRFLYDSATRQIADYDAGALTTRHIFGTGLTEPLIDINAGTGALTYLHADAGESIVATSNSAGNTVNTYSYSPFGGSPSLSGTTFGYAGQRYDAESGFYYCRARYFAPILGRFLQTDPAGPDALWNPYTYTANDPLNLSDPLGLDPSINSGDDNSGGGDNGQLGLVTQLRASSVYAGRQFRAFSYGFQPGGRQPLTFTVNLGNSGEYNAALAGRVAYKLLPFLTAGGFAKGAVVGGTEAAGVTVADSLAANLVAGSQAAGGHLIERHVGQTVANLALRLSEEANIPAASTFASEAQAVAGAEAALAQNAGKIASWLGSGAKGTLPLNATFSGGTVLVRGAAGTVTGTGVRFIIRGNGSGGFFFLTGFPTP